MPAPPPPGYPPCGQCPHPPAPHGALCRTDGAAGAASGPASARRPEYSPPGSARPRNGPPPGRPGRRNLRAAHGTHSWSHPGAELPGAASRRVPARHPDPVRQKRPSRGAPCAEACGCTHSRIRRRTTHRSCHRRLPGYPALFPRLRSRACGGTRPDCM